MGSIYLGNYLGSIVIISTWLSIDTYNYNAAQVIADYLEPLCSNDVITTEVKRNERNLPVHWSSKVPKWYKRNAIISDLNRVT